MKMTLNEVFADVRGDWSEDPDMAFGKSICLMSWLESEADRQVFADYTRRHLEAHGMPARVRLSGNQLKRVAKRAGWCLVDELQVIGDGSEMANALLELPEVARLRGLSFEGVGLSMGAVVRLATNPYLAGLEWLDVRETGVGEMHMLMLSKSNAAYVLKDVEIRSKGRWLIPSRCDSGLKSETVWDTCETESGYKLLEGLVIGVLKEGHLNPLFVAQTPPDE